MAKHKMYENSPKMEHGEDGKVKVTKDQKSHEKKSEVKTSKEAKGDEGEHKGEAVADTHGQDIKDMHKRHTAEFKDMHARHEKEMGMMHTKHQKTAGATGGSTDGAPIADIEKEKGAAA